MSNSNNQNGLLVSNLQHLGEDKIHLILASQSPRRREILDMLGLTGRYTATPSPLDESALQLQLLANELVCSPLDYTRTLAEKKAEALALHLSHECSTSSSSSTKSTLVLGSDTIVDLDNVILEKPADAQSARTMLRRLSGVWHRVHTGVAIYHVEADTVKLMSSFTDTAKVKFADLSDADIHAYVETGEPMDKAGSYGIQGIGGQLVERVEGDFFTVMGLPMHLFSRELSKAITELTKSS
jgi:septum formation protein